MSEKNDPNKKHYFRPATLVEFADNMLTQCNLKKPQPITIWEKGEEEDLAELYTVSKYLPEQKILKMNPTGKLITKITGSSKVGKTVLVKIPIEDRINYFTGGILKFHREDLTYSLEIQQDIFKSQQRSNFRLNASKVIPIQFKIDEQVFDALDISIGGTSFLIETENLERFAKGKHFPDCTIRFDRKNYHIPEAVVAGIIPMKDSDGEGMKGKFKIGIAFKNLCRKTEEEIYIKITTESRGEEMKKKFDTFLAKKLAEG